MQSGNFIVFPGMGHETEIVQEIVTFPWYETDFMYDIRIDKKRFIYTCKHGQRISILSQRF